RAGDRPMRRPSTPSGDVRIDRVGARALLGDDLLAIDRHVVGGLDPDPHRAAVDLHDRDPDILAHLKPLTELPAQDQHGSLLLETSVRSARPRSSARSPASSDLLILVL